MGSASRIAWVLLGVGGVSALCALFAPSGAWGPLDLGATGATLFVLSSAAAVALFALRGAQVFPEHMSVTERRAWVALVFLALILAAFAREVFALSQSAPPERMQDLFARRFFEHFAVFVIVWAILAQLVGDAEGGPEEDERDLRLRQRADRAADSVLTVLMISAIVALATLPRDLLAWWLTPLVLANLLIGVLIARSLVTHGLLAISYRMPMKRT